MINRVRRALNEGEIKLSTKLTPEETKRHREFSREVGRTVRQWQQYYRGMIQLLLFDDARALALYKKVTSANAGELSDLTYAHMHGDDANAVESEKIFREYCIAVTRVSKKIARGDLLLQRNGGSGDLSSELNLAQLVEEAKTLMRQKKPGRNQLVQRLIYNRSHEDTRYRNVVRRNRRSGR